MNYDRPSTSAMYQPASSIDQDKIVFAFEREFYQSYGQGEPQRPTAKGGKPTTLFNPFQNGLQLRDQELVDFLNERLGDHEETWAGKNVAAFLSREMIEELETCFQGLEPIAKLKIVLGFSQLSTKRLHDWKKEINTLLEIAALDPDDWVEAISDNLRIFSPTGIIELEPTRNMEVYKQALGRVYHKLLEYANRDDSEFNHVPEVYHFCDEKVIQNELNFSPREPEVHFTVKKKLKGDLLREEVLNELKQPKPSEDKNSGLVTSLPMKFRSTLRKPDLKTPMRGIVQPNAMKINGGFTSEPKKFPRQLSKRDGGAMLIAIDDIPQSHQKRKREADREEREKKKEQADAEKKRLDAERRQAIIEKAEQKKKEAEKMREDAMRRKKEAEAARLVKTEPAPKPAPVKSDPVLAFSDPSLELERLRHERPGPSKMEVDAKREEEEQMDTSEADRAVEWMYQHDELSQSKIGDNKEDDYEFLNRPRPAGLESRETIIQKTTTEVIDSVTCCTLEQQRQIIAFMSGNKARYRPILGHTELLKISDSIQQGIVDDGVCRVRVETFIHMNFDSGEWRKQQKCKVLAENETPSGFDGRHCPRLTHQQIFNEIARHICDEPEDKRFAGESVIVQAYVPAKPVKLSDEKNKLLSPTGSSSDVYGQEVTAGEMMTVVTGISGCIGMRTVVGKSTIGTPVVIAPAPPAAVGAASQQTPRAPPKKQVKVEPMHQQPQAQMQPIQQQQPALVQMSIDAAQLQQLQNQFGAQSNFVLQQGMQLQQPQQQQQRLMTQQPQRIVVQQQPQQQQQQRMLVVPQQQLLQPQPQRFLVQQQQPQLNMPRQQLTVAQFVQQNMSQQMNMINRPTTSQANIFGNNPFPSGAQMVVVNGSNFNLLPQPQPTITSLQQSYQTPQNLLQNVSYQFQPAPNQDQQQQYRYQS